MAHHKGKMAHHGTHHHSAGHHSGHSDGKKVFGTTAAPKGMADGTGKHMNHTSECSPGACSADDYFKGTNEHMYEGGGGGEE